MFSLSICFQSCSGFIQCINSRKQRKQTSKCSKILETLQIDVLTVFKCVQVDIFPLNLAEIVMQDRFGCQEDGCMPKLVRTQKVQEIKAGVGVCCSYGGILGTLWLTRSRRWKPRGMWGLGLGWFRVKGGQLQLQAAYQVWGII